MIVVIDYGMGNVGSVFNMLRKVGAEVVVSAEKTVIEKASKLVLPGVGAFDNGMRNLNQLGLVPVLNDKVLKKRTPILGICLGMQLFAERSEEGVLPGLGWIGAETVRFRFDDKESLLKVPHMGWNTVKIQRKNPFWEDPDSELRFYFVHSYHLRCQDEDDVLTTTHHGYEFLSAVMRENLVGVQFHPEKSHRFGMNFLKRFVEAF